MPSRGHSRRKSQHALIVQVFIRVRENQKRYQIGRKLLDEAMQMWLDGEDLPDPIRVGAVVWKHGDTAPERRADTPEEIDRIREDLVGRLVRGGSLQFQSFRMRETIR